MRLPAPSERRKEGAGFARGAWGIERRRRGATLRIEPFARLSGKQAAAVAAEGRRLLGFAAAGAKARDVEIG